MLNFNMDTEKYKLRHADHVFIRTFKAAK